MQIHHFLIKLAKFLSFFIKNVCQTKAKLITFQQHLSKTFMGNWLLSMFYHCQLILKAFLLQLQNGTIIVLSLSTTSNSLQSLHLT